MEVVMLFDDLESNNLQVVEESRKKIAEVFSSAKEPFFVHGMMDYFSHTNSIRAVDILVKVQPPHDRYILDRLSDWIRVSNNKQHAINLFSHIIMRHPTWLHKVASHSFIKDILKLLKNEKELIPMMGALLCIINLMPIIPSKMSSYLQDLFEVFTHIAAWNCNNPARLTNDLLVHLQIGLYRYFHRLYGMFPCNFLAFLRQEYIVKEKIAIFTHTIKPLLETVKMNPLLVTMNPSGELQQERWKKMEPHDVVYECSRFSLDYLEKPDINECSCSCTHSHSHPGSALIGQQTASFDFSSPSVLATPGATVAEKKFPFLAMPSTVSGTTVAERFVDYTNYDSKIWSPSTMVLATPPPTGTVPHTPNPTYNNLGASVITHSVVSGQDGSSPPEAAIEATPETTPMKDLGKMRNLPTTSTAVRAIFGVPSATIVGTAAGSGISGGGHTSTPSSPMRKETSPFRFPETVAITSTSTSITTITSTSDGSSSTAPSSKKLINIMNDRSQSIRYIQQSSVLSDTSASNPSSPLPPDPNHPALGPRNSDQSVGQPDEDSLGVDEVPKEIVVTEYSAECSVNCETEGSPCSAGGLHLPDTRAVIKFNRGVQRLRLYSHCVNETTPKNDEKSLADGSLAPIMKKTRSLPNLYTKSSLSINDGVLMKNGGGGTSSNSSGGDGSAIQSPQEICLLRATDIIPKIDMATQTIQQWPQFYEHMFPGILGEANVKRKSHEEPANTPHAMLEQYITTSIKKKQAVDTRNWEDLYREQTQLLTLQLQYERHRREVHAERNRRLLGKSRSNRELEEQNRTLHDQVKRLTNENMKIDMQWREYRKRFNQRENDLFNEIKSWKLKFESESEDTRKLREINENLNIKLSEELKLRKEQNIDKETVRGELFDLKNDLRQAMYQAELGQQYRQELTRLQSEMILMGEIQLKCKEKLNEVDMLKARDIELDQLQYGYSEEIRDIRSSLEIKITQLETARHRIAELEAALSRRDNVVTEEKKQLKATKEEYQEKFNALERKYEAQKAIILRMEENILELYKNQSAVNIATLSPESERDIVGSLDHTSPLSLSLASSDGLSASVHSELKNLQALVGKPPTNTASTNTALSPDCDTVTAGVIIGSNGSTNAAGSSSGNRAGSNRTGEVSDDIPVPGGGTSYHHHRRGD